MGIEPMTTRCLVVALTTKLLGRPISETGPTSQKKVPLSLLFRSTRPGYVRFGRDSSHGKPAKRILLPGLCAVPEFKPTGRNSRPAASPTRQPNTVSRAHSQANRQPPTAVRPPCTPPLPACSVFAVVGHIPKPHRTRRRGAARRRTAQRSIAR